MESIRNPMRFAYHTEQRVPYPLSQVFNFFANPANLPSLMPAWQHARIDSQSLTPPPQPSPDASNTPVAGAGSQITLSFRPFPDAPFRLSWDAEIAEFAWNEHFCDLQLRGPFAYWKHCHSVRRADAPGTEATLITDDVEYELPFGMAGQIAHSIFLQRQIERTFAFRQTQLTRILAQVKPEPQPLQVDRIYQTHTPHRP